MGNLTINQDTKREIKRLAEKLNVSQSELVTMLYNNYDIETGTKYIIIKHLNNLRGILPPYYSFLLNNFQAMLFTYSKLDSKQQDVVLNILMKLQSDMSKKRLSEGNKEKGNE